MKLKFVFAMTAATSLFVAPVFADHHAEGKKEAMEAKAEDTVAAYVVAASGGGWSAAKKVSSALSTQSGVETVILSGLRATVIMKDGSSLVEADVKSALESNGLKFVSFEKADLVRPKAAYELAVTGATWAIKNDKARAALENLDGVSGAYVNGDIALHLAKDEALDEKAVAAAIKEFGMKVKGSTKVEVLPF